MPRVPNGYHVKLEYVDDDGAVVTRTYEADTYGEAIELQREWQHRTITRCHIFPK